MKPAYGQEAIYKYCSAPGVSMSTRPEYYSGRGVITSDLGPRHLKAIYDGLVADFGQETADQFCLMIEDLTNLSATNFLNQFYSFFDRGLVWRGKGQKETDIDLGPDDGTGAREAVAFVTIAGALFGRESSPEVTRDLSNALKRSFFQLIGYTPKYPEKVKPSNRTIDGFDYRR